MEETKTGTIFIRTKKERNYTVMDNTFLRDERLSAKAKGIFAYILYLPEDWCIYQSELVKHFSDGKDALRAAIKELETLGYISKEHIKDIKTGRFTHWQYTVNETPKTPKADFPKLDFPKLENPPLLNTDNKINTNNNKISEVDTSDFPEDPNEIKPKKTILSKKPSKTELNEQVLSSLPQEEREEAIKCVDEFIELHKLLDPYYNRDKCRPGWQIDFVKYHRKSNRPFSQIRSVMTYGMTDNYWKKRLSSPEVLFNAFETILQQSIKSSASQKSNYQKKQEDVSGRANMNTENENYTIF